MEKRRSLENYYFLCGLPRSGSTVLSVILNQNPKIHVSTTSPVPHFLYQANVALSDLSETYNFLYDKISMTMNEFMIEVFYNHIQAQYIIDKNRSWAGNINPIKYHINDQAKVICLIRPIPEILVSFMQLFEKDPDSYIHDKISQGASKKEISEILWEDHLKDDYNNILDNILPNQEEFLILQYDELCNNPKQTMERIYKYLEINDWEHRFDNLSNQRVNEDGNEGNFKVKNLHVIRPEISKQSMDAKEYLGDELFEYYSNYNINI